MSRGPLVDEVRAELAAIAPGTRCDRLAETSALFHTAGTVHLRGRGRLAFHLDLATNGIARRAFALLRELGVPAEIRTYTRPAFDRATRYQLHLEGDETTRGVLVEAGVLSADHHVPLERPPGRVVARACCRGAYLRGAFLASGSLSAPPSLHLELRSPGHAAASAIRSVAASAGVELKVVDRTQHSAAYAKGRHAVEAFLTTAGASESVLTLEEEGLITELRGHANRVANADHANLVRQSRAASRTLDAIERLEQAGTWSRLDEEARTVGELRRRFPTLSVRELARRADPPLSHSALQRRLARIEAAAGP
ncbi:MAG: DNA-binding protein WhiA [Gaiella sp.]